MTDDAGTYAVSRTKVLFLDLDSTLCNDAHRAHHAEARDWDKYHALAGIDTPRWDILSAVRALVADKRLVFLTTRPAAYREATVEWLTTWCPDLLRLTGPGPYLLMRPDSDTTTTSPVLKELLAFNYFEQDLPRMQAETFAVLDDRQDVVDRFRALRVPAWNVGVAPVGAPCNGDRRCCDGDRRCCDGQ